MSELGEIIKVMMENIEGYCALLISEGNKLPSGIEKDREQIKPALMAGLAAMIDEMLLLYDRPEFSEVREDKDYWSAQRVRICEAIDSRDVFFTIDVLKNETEENLKLFLKML